MERLRYMFVRYCVNRAYMKLNFDGLSADDVNFLDSVVSQLKDLEHTIYSHEDFANMLRGPFVQLYETLAERLPTVAKEFFTDVLKNCLELDEVKMYDLVDVVKDTLHRIDSKQ